MIRTILGFFGYIKITTSAVQLSIRQEDFFRGLIKLYKNRNEDTEIFELYLGGQEALTNYLRSGKLLN